MSLSVHPSTRSSLRHQPTHTKPCVEPLERRTLLSAALVQQGDSVGVFATFQVQQTAAEWGLPSPGVNPDEVVEAIVYVNAGESTLREAGQPAPTDTYAAVGVQFGGFFYYFGQTDVSVSFTADHDTFTLDAQVPVEDLYTGALVNASVHMVWDVASQPTAEFQTFHERPYVDIVRWLTRDATATGTVTIDAFGPVNFTPGTSQSAGVVRFSQNSHITPQPTTAARELFSQSPVLN